MPQDNKAIRLIRLLFFLSGSYPKSKEECADFLKVGDSSFYNYCNEIKNIGFNLLQKNGKYWVEYDSRPTQMLANLLHFTDEEAYILAKSIDSIEGYTMPARRLKEKLVSFLNHDKALGAYLKKDKPEIVSVLNNAIKTKKQVLLIDYASGNSMTIRNRLVEPFEFKEDFSLVWAYDIDLQKNRQFKICRIDDVEESPIFWKYESSHRSLPVDVFRNTGELNKDIEFRLTLRARNLLIEEYPLAEKHLTEITKTNFHFRAPVAKYEGPGRFVLGIAEDIKLVGDDGFLEFVKEKVLICEKLFTTPR